MDVLGDATNSMGTVEQLPIGKNCIGPLPVKNILSTSFGTGYDLLPLSNMDTSNYVTAGNFGKLYRSNFTKKISITCFTLFAKTNNKSIWRA